MLKAIPTTTLFLLAAGLAPTASAAEDTAAGAKLYAANCAACHGATRAGIPGTFPALTDVGKRLDPKQIKEKITKGGGLMPPFSQLSEKDVEDITVFLKQ